MKTITKTKQHFKGVTLMAACLFSFTAFAQVDHDLVLALDFENGRVDSSIQNQSTSQAGTVTYAADRWNHANAAAYFHGNSNSGIVLLTNPAETYKVNYPATISAWVKLNAFTSPSSPILTTEDKVYEYSGLWLEITSAGAVSANYGSNAAAGASSRKTFTTTAGTIALNNWYHIVAVYDSAGAARIYVNGFRKAITVSGAAAGCVYQGAGGYMASVGKYYKGSTTAKTLDGYLDKVRIYGAALSEEEILALYYNSYANFSTLLLNYPMNHSPVDYTIFHHNSVPIGNCMYEDDRQALPTAALSAVTNSGVEVNEPAGNFKADFPLTFSTWMRLNGPVTSNRAIFTNDDNASAFTGVSISLVPPGNIRVRIGSGNGILSTDQRLWVTVDPVTTDGQWDHLAVVLNADTNQVCTAQIYLNGILQPLQGQIGSGTGLGYGTGIGSGARIGASYQGSSTLTWFDGGLDDVMFWHDSLSQVQILDLYNNYYNGDMSIGIEENKTESKSSFLVYPNPAASDFTILLKDLETASYGLFDIAGKKVKAGTLSQAETKVNSTDLSPGIYFIRISSGNSSSVQKLVISQ
jgi:hypothetical protein